MKTMMMTIGLLSLLLPGLAQAGKKASTASGEFIINQSSVSVGQVFNFTISTKNISAWADLRFAVECGNDSGQGYVIWLYQVGGEIQHNSTFVSQDFVVPVATEYCVASLYQMPSKQSWAVNYQQTVFHID